MKPTLVASWFPRQRPQIWELDLSDNKTDTTAALFQVEVEHRAVKKRYESCPLSYYPGASNSVQQPQASVSYAKYVIFPLQPKLTLTSRSRLGDIILALEGQSRAAPRGQKPRRGCRLEPLLPHDLPASRVILPVLLSFVGDSPEPARVVGRVRSLPPDEISNAL